MMLGKPLCIMSSVSVYHLVCRDCEYERILESAEVARQQAADHEAITDHRIAFKQVH